MEQPAIQGTQRLASAGRALDKVQTGLKLVDAVLKIGEGAGLPLIPAVCSAARGVLKVVQASRIVISDVLSAAQRTIDVLELLQLMAKNMDRMDAIGRASVEDRMRKLQRLLDDVRSAVAAFGKKGWLRHALKVGRRSMLSLDSEITGQLDLLLKFYNLTRDADIIERLQAREYAVEAEVERQVVERTAKGEAVDADALEKDCEVVRGIAVASGLSEAEFQEELSELRSEVREAFAQQGLKIDKVLEQNQKILEQLSLGSVEPVHSSRLSHYAYERRPDAPPGKKGKAAAWLGGGTFGSTYRARKKDGVDDRRYALKFVEDKNSELSELAKEARQLAHLDHPHTVRYFDAFWHTVKARDEDEEDTVQFVIVMELLEGGSLQAKITAPPQPPSAVATWVRQVASGLAYMHSLNQQHRDLKPANVMLDATGRAKIIDFGLACLSSAASRRSRTKTKVGTDAYMSPEKAVGKRYGPADDVWAAGCILAELLLGRTIGNVALDAAKRQRAIAESKAASEQLGSWVEGCLQESPGRRPAAAVLEQRLASDLGAREAEERRREDATDRSQAEERLPTPEAHRKLAPAPAAAKPAESKPQFEIALAGGGLRELNQGRPGGGKLSLAATPALASGGPGAHEAEERRLREQAAVAAFLDEKERVRREAVDRSRREAGEARARQEAAENSSSSDVPTLMATPELVASGADDLLDLMGGGGGGATPSGGGGGDLLDLLGGGAPAVPAAAAGGGPSPQWLALCMRNDGVLFEDATLQIGVKMEFNGHQGRMALFYGNKGQFPLQQLAAVLSPCPQLAVQVSPLPSTLQPRQQLSQNFLIVCNAQFGDGPQVKVSFIGGSGPAQIVARLPLNPSKFFAPLVIDGGDFFRRWKLFEGKELQKIFKLKTTPLAEPEAERVCAGKMKMAVLRGVDPNTANYVVAGWMAVKGGAPKSDMASVNAAAGMCRATVRASDVGLATAVAQIVQSHFAAPSGLSDSGGISPMSGPELNAAPPPQHQQHYAHTGGGMSGGAYSQQRVRREAVDRSRREVEEERAQRKAGERARQEAAGNSSSSDVPTPVAVAEAGDIAPLVALARDGADGQKEEAVQALGRLACNADDKVAIAKAGGIAPLVALARDGTQRQMGCAAWALEMLAFNDADNQVSIAKEGGIPPLVALARGGTDGQKKYAAGALGILAFNAANQTAIAKAGGIAPLVALARGGTQMQKELAARALRNLARNDANQKEHAAGALWNLALYKADNDDDNQVAIAKAGGIAPLVALARGGTDGQKEHAAAALANLAGNADNRVAIAKAGGIPPLVALARGGTDGQKEQAAGALRNLAYDADNKVAIARAGGIPPLVALARDGTDGQKEQAVALLSNLAYNNAENQVAIAKAGGIAPLVALACGGTDGQKEQAVAALRNLVLDAANKVAIATAGGIPPLVALARDGTQMQKELAAGALRNLAYRNSDNQVAIARAGGILPLVALARGGTDGQKEMAADALGWLAHRAENKRAIENAGWSHGKGLRRYDR